MANSKSAAHDLFTARLHDTVYSLNSFWRFRARDGGGSWEPIPLETIRAELLVGVQRLGTLPTARLISSLLDDLRHLVAHQVSDWNRDPGLLPCQNGLLRLATGELAPHPASQLFARSLPVPYDPSAQAPAWQAFLSSTVPAAADFLQEFAGLALTFEPRYETALWLYGPPGSGKSTFLIGLQAMLGDRAGQLDLLTLARRRLPAAYLLGRSLLVSSEQPLRDLEQDNLLNALISGEPIALAGLGREPDPEEFAVTLRAKWIWAMVSLPRLTRGTSGLYRRVRVVPFPPRAEADRDPFLKERIAREGSGILNWTLAGLARLNQRGHFDPPPIVTAAGQSFLQANDIVAQFVAENCALDPSSQASSGDLYRAYVACCRASGLRPESTNALAVEWERLGLVRRRVHGVAYWQGLSLRPIASNRNQTGFEPTPDSAATAATAATYDPATLDAASPPPTALD